MGQPTSFCGGHVGELGWEGRKMRGEVYVKIEKHGKVCVAKEYYVGNNFKVDLELENHETMLHHLVEQM